ncbi:helix-turn-helix domain-containing protein [Agrobacterium sp. Azo12]|uniref:helix-turn-helix domain-containing protein n=1 Tax=Agrobacterium sp. Azo12 TaxID=3031129 RepID=UPI0023D7FB62|nr:helix-turn-helix transcriptional regulator [Agrobacterium sp. Azo12]MDO5897883.1 helix-turn-helix transcriptional regulator [Agrobacterium sp. Azo12]
MTIGWMAKLVHFVSLESRRESNSWHKVTLVRVVKSFSMCVQDLMDSWIDSGDAIAALDVYKAVVGPMEPNVILAVIDCRDAIAGKFSVEFIRPYSVPTTALDFLALQRRGPLDLQDLADSDYLKSAAIPALIEVIHNKRPSFTKGNATFESCKIIYEQLLIPQKSSVGRGEWCILLSKIDLLLAEVPKFHAEGFDLCILQLLTEGASQKEIAAKMDLSYRTIEHRIERLKARIGAKNLQHLVALWITSNL